MIKTVLKSKIYPNKIEYFPLSEPHNFKLKGLFESEYLRSNLKRVFLIKPDSYNIIFTQ